MIFMEIGIIKYLQKNYKLVFNSSLGCGGVLRWLQTVRIVAG